MSNIEREVDDDNDTDREHCSSTHKKKKKNSWHSGGEGLLPFPLFC